MRPFWERVRNFLSADLIREMREQAAVDRVLRQPEPIVHFSHKGEEYRFYVPDAGTDFIQTQLCIAHTFFEGSTLAALLNRFDLKGAHIVDAGANIGNHSVYFARVAGVARCLAFEPNPYVAGIMRRNLELNRATAVELTQAGLSNDDQPLSYIKYRSTNLGAATLAPGGSDGVPAIALDSLNLPRCDFMKIDVEGMADRMIAGATRTIVAFRPTLFIELLAHERTHVDALLRRLGYRAPVSLGHGNYLYEHQH